MRESVLIRIASDPVARLWNGVGDLVVMPDGYIEEEISIYKGGAQLVSVADFQQLINGTAERLDFQLSGVSAESVQMAIEEAPSVEGANLDLGTIQFDDSWQPLGPVVWEAQFRCDKLTVANQIDEQRNRVRTISLSVGTEDTGRSRAPISLFTDADQRRRSPDDDFFNQVAAINGGTSRRFGPS